MIGQRKSELAMLAAPIIVVLVLQATSQLHPQSSVAQSRTFNPQTHTTTPRTAPTNALDTWLHSLTIDQTLHSPMDHGPTPEVQVTTPSPSQPVPQPTRTNPLQDALLSSVIGAGKQGLATINGRLYRINDEPAPGCIIINIDAKRKSVTVKLASGELYHILAKRQ